MTLDEFMDVPLNAFKMARAHVQFAHFSTLYVRRTVRHIHNIGTISPVLDIASMETQKPGTGNLRTLVKHLTEQYPEYWIYIENVLNERLPKFFIENGFRQLDVEYSGGVCFLKEPSRYARQNQKSL